MPETTEITTPQTTAVAQRPKTPLQVVGDQVRKYVEADRLVLPADYSAENALKSAWSSIVQNEKINLKECTHESVVNAMFDMAVQGMNVTKNQGYFIKRKERLYFQRSYFGDIALAKRVEPGIKVVSQVVYEKDTFEFAIIAGSKTVTQHKQALGNIKMDEIAGGYCEVFGPNNEIMGAEVMTMEQIAVSWNKSQTYEKKYPSGDEIVSFHDEQPDQAVLRTVTRRRLKAIINSSSDFELMKSVRRQDIVSVESEAAEEVGAFANTETLSIPARTETVQAAKPEAEAERTPEHPEPEVVDAEEFNDEEDPEF